MSKTTSNLGVMIAGLIALIIGLVIFNTNTQPSRLDVDKDLQHATYLYDQQVAIPEFNFIDHNGDAFNREQIKGQWTLWFFGFTHCPDICPTTLATLSNSLNLIEKNQSIDDLKIVFVSVDPERDTPVAMNNYISSFHKNIIGTSGYDGELATFLKNMGIIATLNKATNDAKDYQVDHSSALYLIAPNNAISAVFNTPHSASTIAQDYQTIKKYYR